MALSAQKFREIVFQLLYSDDFAKSETDDIFDFLMGQMAVTRKNLFDANAVKEAIQEKLSVIDAKIQETSTAYEMERIPQIEKNILRLAVYELSYGRSIPAKVAIAEAIRLTRKFAAPEGASFVNAILDNIYQCNLKKAESSAS
jgi:N utilization substance protein B